MKVKMLHTIGTIAGLNYSASFSSTKYKIEYTQSPQGYIIDNKTFIPFHYIKEVSFEAEEPKQEVDVSVDEKQKKPRKVA